MVEYMKGQTPEELNFNYTLEELKAAARELKIKGRSKMDKMVLVLNIEEALNDGA